MQHRSALHLVVPGICGPLAETQSLQSSAVIEQWLRTLARSSCLPSADNFNDVIAEVLGLTINGDFPSAPLTLLANDNYETGLYYMHADPVHLQADMDHAVLTSSTDLAITEEEAAALCVMLDQHFRQDGLTFFTLNKDQWFVSSKEKISMKTTPLVDATGRNINFLLPQGRQATQWKQRLTEAQMLLHSHEVNVTRENAGLSSINSLWFYGCGELAGVDSEAGSSFICSNDDMLKGLARHIDAKYQKVPDKVNDYADYLLSCKPGTVSVLHISELEHLVNYTDTSLWLAKLTALLDGWIYPLLAAANKNNIKVTLYPCSGKKYRFSKYDFLKFWCRDKLEKHVNCY